MAEHKVTIDVEARFTDGVTRPAGQAEKSIDDLEKAAKEAAKEVDSLGKKKAKPSVDADTSSFKKKLDESEKRARAFSRAKIKTVLDAVDNASHKIQNIEEKAKRFTGKTWEAVVKVKDLALSPLRKLHDMIFNIKTLIGGIMAGFAVNQFIMKPIHIADQMVNTLSAFRTMLGEQAGEAKYHELMDFAKKTPFNATDVISNAQQLIGYGFDPENITEVMERLGDMAAGTGKGNAGLSGLALVLGQIKARPTLSAQDLNQISGWGIDARGMLMDYLGVKDMQTLATMQEKGKITGEQAVAAILAGAEKRYGGLMEKNATTTFNGIWETITDTLSIDVFSKWGEGLQKGGIAALTRIVDLLDASDEKLAEFGNLLFDVGQKISTWVAGKLESAIDKISALMSTEEFKNASTGGKLKILWDGVIADPLKEWWEGGGRQKAAQTAGKIGTWLGRTMSGVLIGIFKGTDVLNDGLGEKEGAGIAESFVRGFVDNFDAAAVADAFKDAISNIWNALPVWAKFLVGGVGASKVMSIGSTLFGGAASIYKGAKGFIGTPGNAMMSGTGILSKLADIGYNAKGGAAVNVGMTGGQAALAGGKAMIAAALPFLAAAGGIYGAQTTIGGVSDIVKGYQENDALAKKTGAGKLVGVGSGAAIGAAIGSVIPGLGTLIGAGIGAGAGALFGNWGASNMRKNEARGKTRSELEELAKSESDLAQEAANEIIRRNKLVSESAKEHFGKVVLSLEEIEELAKSITIGDKVKEMTAFADATQEAENRVTVLAHSAEELNKWNWKAGIKFKANQKLTAEEKQQYLQTADAFIQNAKDLIEAKHYEVTAAVQMLIKPEDESNQKIIDQMDSFYNGMQEQVDSLNKELKSKITLALEDGQIDPESEGKVIADLQNQIAEITNKIAKAQSEAELETIKIKFSSGQLDYDSFTKLQQELKAQIESSSKQYDQALTTSITSLKLQLDEKAISQEEYDKQIKALTEGYNANLGEIKASANSIQLEIIGDAYEDILGEDGRQKLSTALARSVNEGIDPIDWKLGDAKRFLGIESLDEKTAVALGNMLSTMADKEEIAEAAAKAGDSILKKLNPSEEALSDWGSQQRKSIVDTLDKHFDTPVSVGLKVNLKPTYTGLPSGLTSGNFSVFDYVPGKADGGIVSGGAQLVRVAEEGTPEAIIPLGSQRRERGLQLWKQAGHMLGVPGFARGGILGAGEDRGLRFQQDETVGGATGQPVQVDVVGVTLEINVNGDQEGGGIKEAIKAQAEEIAETVAGILADAFQAQFENTPVRGGAAG